MKSPKWNQQLFGVHRDYIDVEEVRRAFDYLAANAFHTDLYSVQNSGLNKQKKSFHYDEIASGQRPFAFIVNHGHLLFYIRLAGQKRFSGGMEFFKQSFATVSENPDGEWTIRIESRMDATRIQAMVFETAIAASDDNSYSNHELAQLEERASREIEMRSDIGPTEKEQLILARRGQGRYRQSLESLESRCRVTQVSDPRHLRASHIKPWCKSDDREKLDAKNGLLLSPHVDHLFDRGYISFTDAGDLMVSKHLNPTLLAAWGLGMILKTSAFSPEQCVYLEYHRREVFQK
jgi:hypothetical protein